MPGLIERGTEAFSRGNYAEAAAAFQKLQEIYSEEPEWQETRLSEKLMPLAGYASLKAGLYDQAVDSLAEFLDQENSAYSQEIFVRYTLALALKRKGKHEDALGAFKAFRESSSSVSQKGIAYIHEADIHFKTENPDVAMQVLQGVVGSDAAIRVRTQARLRLLQEQLNQKKLSAVAQTLFNSRWDSDTMPELALLAFLALEAGDAFLKNSMPTQALRAYQLVPDKSTLEAKQAQKLSHLRTVFDQRKKEIGMEGFMWTDLYEQVIQSAAHQLEALKNAPDYSEPLAVRRGRASLLAGRSYEAWLLFERIAMNPESALAETAHLNWILAAKELHRFKDAIQIANDYLERYPSSDSVDDALLLIASSLIDSQRYDEAINALTELSENAANPAYRVSSLYQRGQCYMRLGQYPTAKDDFDKVAETAADALLKQRAALWSGMSLFLQGQLEPALVSFTELHSNATSPELEGESLYRAACCQYSLSNYEAAIQLLVEFSNQFAGHAREFEAQLLLGDSYFAQNRFEDAIKRYQSIPDDLPNLAHLAAIQTALAYEETGQHNEAVRVLERRSRTTADPDRFTEIQLLYADLQLEKGNQTKAAAALEHAVSEHGNAFHAENMLDALEQLVSLKGYNYKSLFQKALDKGQLNLAARIGLLRALALRDEGSVHQSNEAFLELANEIPIEDLPPECLAHIGLELTKLEFENGPQYHELLLAKYPNSNYSPFAYYGFAKVEAESNRLGVALGWLNRIGTDNVNSPIYVDTLQLEGDLKIKLGEYPAAQEAFETILSFRWASPREKATSLLSLAKLKELEGSTKQAVAYCQRVFTLYPSVTEAAARGYLDSARYLAQIEEPEKAKEILTEFLGRSDYRHTEQFRLAKDLLSRLNERTTERQKA